MKKANQELDTFAKHLTEVIHSLVQYLRNSHWSERGEASTGRPTRSSVRTSTRRRTPSIEWPWDSIMKSATKLLRNQPDRRWKPGEFCQAVKAASDIESAKGLHFGLLPRLRKMGLIANAGRGTFKALPARTAAKNAAPSKMARGKKTTSHSQRGALSRLGKATASNRRSAARSSRTKTSTMTVETMPTQEKTVESEQSSTQNE